TGGEDAITKVFTLLLQNRLGTRYDFQVREIPYAAKFLEYAETQPVDLFVIVLNNIITDAQALFPDTFRFDQVVQIISCLKKKYRKPVIALAGGWPKENKSYIAEVIEAGADQFFGLPPDPDAFIEAVRKCLESPESTI